MINEWTAHAHAQAQQREARAQNPARRRVLKYADWLRREDNRMRMLQRREQQPLGEGKQQTRLVFADREWEVETQIKTTDHPWIRRVEVSVYESSDEEGRQGPYGYLSGFLGQY